MIRILDENDRKMVEAYIERNHIECTFIIGNVKCFGLNNNKSYRRCGDYFGYFEDGELKGILPFYNLGSVIPHFESINAVDEFSNIMKERDFEYLLGMKKFIAPLYEKIKDCKEIEKFSENSYFINDDFKPFNLEELEIKHVWELNIDDVVDFLIEASDLGFGRKESREETIDSIKQKPKDEEYIFGVKEGRIVSQANIQTTTTMINQIGAVYTTPEERGNGYCKATVSKLCEIIISRGKTPTLVVRKNNTPAVRAYTALGFKFYDDYLLIKLK